MIDASIVFVGCVRDCGSYINNVVSNIEKVSANFRDHAVVFAENDSNDDTKGILSSICSSRAGYDLLNYDGLSKRIPKRTDRLAFLRNELISHVSGEKYREYDAVCVIDFDDVNSCEISQSGFEDAFRFLFDNGKTAGVFCVNDPVYYDIWALRHDNWCPGDCWKEIRDSAPEKRQSLVRRLVHDRQVPIREDVPPIPVRSAFGGIAIYKKSLINSAKYIGLDDFGDEICEHVSFNLSLIEDGFALFIYPRMRNKTPWEHVLDLGGSKKMNVGGGFELFAPKDHQLDSYMSSHPLYDRRLPMLLQEFTRRFGGVSLIDVGSNILDTIALSISSGAIFTKATCIDASLDFYKYASINYESNREYFGELDIVWGFVGNASDATNIVASLGTGSFSSSSQSGSVFELQVPRAISLNEFADNVHDVVKIDLDGYDHEVIRDGMGFIRSVEPILWAEALVNDVSGVQSWASVLKSLSQTHDRFLAFDNFGFLMSSGMVSEKLPYLVESIDLSFRYRRFAGVYGQPRVYYIDIVFFPQKHAELYEGVLRMIPERPILTEVSSVFDQSAFVRRQGSEGDGRGEMVAGGASAESFRVSAIVSTYNSERFMRGCLESLVSQSLGEAVEIIVIDSGSPQNERAIVEEFQTRHPNIVYVRTERESLYEAWSRGVRMARAPYLTNANTDDRLFANALEVLADTLDANPEVMLAYADQFVTDTPEVGPDACRFVGAFHLDEFDRYTMLDKCYVGPQPMWRRSVHDEVGYFDARYRSAGDYEFWLRIARRFPLLHVPQRLGVYFQNDQGIELSNTGLSREEGLRAIASYVPAYLTPAELLVPDGRFRLVAPLRGGDVTGWVTEIVDAYLQACGPDDPVTLYLVVEPSLADDLVLTGLVEALARHGLTLEDAFADISFVRMPPVELLAWAPVLAAGDRLLVNPLDAPMSLLVEDLGLRPPLEPDVEMLRSALASWDVAALDVACWVVPEGRHPGARIREWLALPGKPRVTVIEGAAAEELDLDGIHGRIRVVPDSLVGLTPAVVSSRSDVFVVAIADGDLAPIDPEVLAAMVREMRRDPDLGVLALEGAALWVIRTRFHVDPVRSLEQLLEDVRARGGTVLAWTPGAPVVGGA